MNKTFTLPLIWASVGLAFGWQTAFWTLLVAAPLVLFVRWVLIVAAAQLAKDKAEELVGKLDEALGWPYDAEEIAESAGARWRRIKAAWSGEKPEEETPDRDTRRWLGWF